MFEYEFMLPCIGLPILLKRLSMMGDTLSHASLAGVAIGLCFGFDPLLGSVVACIIAGLSTEILSARLKSYQEISTVIVLAASIGLAGIFTSLAGNSNSISSYLFGSIVTIGDLEFYLVICVAFIVIVTYKLLYNRLYLSVFDQYQPDELCVLFFGGHYHFYCSQDHWLVDCLVPFGGTNHYRHAV